MIGEISKLSFSIQPFESVFAITPALNGASLTGIVSAFEREHQFEPAGGYGGLVPQWFEYGPLDRYFFGDFEENSYFAKLGDVYLLGCQCGEVGCWPLTARITVNNESVLWDMFQQPHRRERDYSRFGPFVFELAQYRNALALLCDNFRERVSQGR